jgi:cell division protein FtsL
MAKENSIYSLLRAKFLIEDKAFHTWKFILYIFCLAMIMIYFNHRYDEKNYQITKLNNQVKLLRSKFVDTRSELMKLKMESSIAKKVESKNILPSTVPPKKIVIYQVPKKSFWEKLKIWQ